MNEEIGRKYPATIAEAVELFDKALSSEDLEAIAKTDERDLIGWHDSAGRWIRNNCGLWDNSCSGNPSLRISVKAWSQGNRNSLFINQGEFQDHPDTYSQLILLAWHRKIHGVESVTLQRDCKTGEWQANLGDKFGAGHDIPTALEFLAKAIRENLIGCKESGITL